MSIAIRVALVAFLRALALAITAFAKAIEEAEPEQTKFPSYMTIQASGLPDRTVRRAIKNGQLKARLVGRSLLLASEDVKAFIEAHKSTRAEPEPEEIDPNADELDLVLQRAGARKSA